MSQRGTYVGAIEEMMCVVCVLQRGDGCDLVSTLCKYDVCFLYIILSTTVSFLDLKDVTLFLQGLLFCVHVHTKCSVI